jgi:hypothetical protein
MRQIILFLCNSLIFLSTIKESILFFFSMYGFQNVQHKKGESLIQKNKNTLYFKSIKDKSNIPLSTWNHYETFIQLIIAGEKNVLTKEKVLLLEPSSGTTAPTKYIPYTRSLQKEFNRSIGPWLTGIYLNWPKLLFCSQYWSISPEAMPEIKNKKQIIPIGFEQDSQYLGKGRGGILDKIMAVPSEIKKCDTHENWAYQTAFFLLREGNLGLISIWHPSFLSILLDKIKQYYNSLVDDIEKGCNSINPKLKSFPGFDKIRPKIKRASHLKTLDILDKKNFTKIWPNLKIISCWADDPFEPCLQELKGIFHKTFFQAKGLIATEGIVSFPFGKTFGLPAFRSHMLEFIDIQNESIKTMDQIEKGRKYEVVLTTAGGLYRYRMNDVVQVNGRYKNRLPLLRFLYKRDYISDIRGEKLSLQHVIELQAEIKNKFPEIQFFMLSPVLIETKAFYTCFIYPMNDKAFPFMQFANYIDEKLKQNFHYQYAREIGQLGRIRIFKLQNDPIEAMINYIESTGTKRGDIKLYPLSSKTVWADYLKGGFVDNT